MNTKVDGENQFRVNCGPACDFWNDGIRIICHAKISLHSGTWKNDFRRVKFDHLKRAVWCNGINFMHCVSEEIKRVFKSGLQRGPRHLPQINKGSWEEFTKSKQDRSILYRASRTLEWGLGLQSNGWLCSASAGCCDTVAVVQAPLMR